jgi:uncharacterized membrane protein YdjX (TVP38/TMEM64 family)
MRTEKEARKGVVFSPEKHIIVREENSAGGRRNEGSDLKRPVLYRILIILAVALVVVGLVYIAFIKILPDMLPVLRRGNEEEIETYLRSHTSIGGMICTALLQFIQVVSIILPSAPIQIAAGIVYGSLRGFLLCFFSNMAANIAVFYAARRLDKRLDKFFPMQRGKLMDRIRFLKDSDMPVYMTSMACLIPLVANGIVPYAAASTKMTMKQFILGVALGCWMPILVMCAIGGRILEGDYLLAIVFFAASLAVVLVLMRFRTQVMNFIRRVTTWLHTGVF